MMSKLMLCSSFLMASVAGHGLISYPPSRNQICGVQIKPHQNDARCAKAFEGQHNIGYNFMGVLTHTKGRKAKASNHVCSYDAEPWKGIVTPWDKPLDWPTNKMRPGRNEIDWDIQWGNHFGDTEEFVYYITKPNFVYTVGRPLKWSDFESEPFCNLRYNDANPNANPDVEALHDQNKFKTYCNVPARSGRHVIYGEWGRNHHTYERFHGCIDAQFSGGAVNPPVHTRQPMPVYTQPPKRTRQPMPVYTRPPRYTRQPMPVYTRPPRQTRAPHYGGGCSRRVPKWGNCHKAGSCCIRSSCKFVNPWYSQCL